MMYTKIVMTHGMASGTQGGIVSQELVPVELHTQILNTLGYMAH
jgi:hypothetical protein